MKPRFIRFLFLVGALVVLVTPFEYSATIFVGYETGSPVERDCYPSRGTVYCPTLEDAWKYIVPNVDTSKSVEIKIWRSCSWNSTLDTCKPTPIILSSWLKFTGHSNLALVGGTKRVTILCKPNNLTIGAGLAFTAVRGLIIRNLTLDGCGTYVYFSNYRATSAAINIADCINVTLESMDFRNGAGPGVRIRVAESIRTVVKILCCSFNHNLAFAGGGMYIGFYSSFNNSIAIVGCNFSKNVGTDRGGGVAINLLGTGNIIFQDCKFDQNNAMHGGGVALVASNSNNNTLTFYNCVWYRNTANFTAEGRGGGMQLIFNEATQSVVNISCCSFNHNLADYGGGLYIRTNSLFKNSVMIAGCNFSKNVGTDRGGGVAIYLFGTGNGIIFQDCKFDQNNAMYGGGVALVASNSNNNNTLTFYNCAWCRNTANFTAAAVELSSSGLALSQLIPEFDNCHFIGNEAISQSATQWNIARGTLVATRYEVHFSGSVVFKNNTGSGIYAISSLIRFHSGIEAKFINNFGINGGAMALRLSSSLQVSANSTLLFANNSALLRGAAIYADDIDDYFSSSECFIHIGKDTCTENVTIAFLENFAGVYAKSRLNFGRAVFATSVPGCNRTCLENNLLEYVVNEDPNTRESRRLMTEKRLFMGQRQIINSIPGKEFNVSLEIECEMQRGVDSVLRTFVLGSTVTIDPAYSYTSTGTLKVYGSPGSKGILVLERIGFPEVYLSADISLQECPPGYIIIDNKGNNSRQLAECNCAWNHEQAYQGILKCNSTLFQASILHGFWAGYGSDSEPATPNNLFSAPCPHGFCSYNTKDYSAFHLLPNIASRSELETCMCGTRRTGRLCGKCSDNHSVYFHSSNYKCGGNRHCRFGALFYVISEILPVTIIFIIVMIFNINFTSGAVNGFIFFAQVLDTLLVDANGTVHLPKGVYHLTQVYQFIYRFFNLDFFGIDSLSFCLWKGATTLDIVAFKYVTVAYALVLVVATILLMNICGCCFYRVFPCLKPRVVKNSVIHGVSAFLVMCYTQCTLVSLRILTRTFLEGLKTSQAVVFYSGNINFYSKEHMIYAIPALICLATVVAIPPTLLLLYPAAWRVLAVCHINNETKYIGRVLTMVERFKPLLDSFQSCFKDNFRYFAGLYFIYRLSAHATYVAISLTHFYTVVEIQVVIMLMLHASIQPYEKRWHNIIDAFLFADLAAINALTMYIYSLATGGKVHAYNHGITVAAYIQLILICLPLIYITVYTLIQLVMKLKSVLTDNRETTPSREDNELPARLLGMEDSDDDDFNYHALHDQHAHELETFHN